MTTTITTTTAEQTETRVRGFAGAAALALDRAGTIEADGEVTSPEFNQATFLARDFAGHLYRVTIEPADGEEA